MPLPLQLVELNTNSPSSQALQVGLPLGRFDCLSRERMEAAQGHSRRPVRVVCDCLQGWLEGTLVWRQIPNVTGLMLMTRAIVKEAATGTVCLDEEDPKILDKILLYIYTGGKRKSVQPQLELRMGMWCVQLLRSFPDIPLEKHQVNFVSDLKRCLTTLNTLISLRKLADFFLLAQLMRRIEKVFHYNLCTLLLDSYTISRGLRSPTPTTRNQLVRAVRRATEHAYGATHATNLQRMLAILLTALQEVLSPAFLDELSRDIDGLREDLFQLLLYKHYPAGFSATPVRLSSEGDHAQNADRRHCASCSARERVSMVLNPFSGNNVRRVFCHWCARDGIAKDFKMVLDAWANGDAQRKTATLKSETSIGRHEGAEDMSAWDLLPFRYGM